MQESITVDVVIVSYYTGDVLFECIKSVSDLKHLNKIIIVNNGNPLEVENKLSNLAKDNSKIIYVSGNGNIGFSKGCNLGARCATAEFLLFLNPDCIVPAIDTLEKLGSVKF